MQRIYLARSTHTSLPLRIVAPCSNIALDIYDVWSTRMNRGGPPEAVSIELLSRNALALEPQLQAVTGQGTQGICYWFGHRIGYAVASPGEPFMGCIAPPSCNVRCFEVDHDDGVLLVLARTMDLAHATYIDWMTNAGRDDWEEVFIQEVSRWLLPGPMATLREDMDIGLTGVGSVCEDGFWHIFPADHEPTFN